MLAVGQDSQARFVELQRRGDDVIVRQIFNLPAVICVEQAG